MNNYEKDERVLKNIQESLANAAIVAGMLLFVKIIYDFITNTAKFETTGWFAIRFCHLRKFVPFEINATTYHSTW